MGFRIMGEKTAMGCSEHITINNKLESILYIKMLNINGL
jgi:hypothetical protein